MNYRWRYDKKDQTRWREPITSDDRDMFIMPVGRQWGLFQWRPSYVYEDGFRGGFEAWATDAKAGKVPTITAPLPTLKAAKAAWIVLYGR